MKKNVGTADRIIRLLLAAVLVVLFVLDVITGTLGIILLVFAGILVFTSLISSCALYLPFRINTRKKSA